jgi:hypothetical protein
MDEEVPVSGAGRGGRGALPGVAARDSAQQGDAYLCGVDQSGPCAYANSDSAVFIGIAGGAIHEGEEFAQAIIGVCAVKEEVLGLALVDARLLGMYEWQCER